MIGAAEQNRIGIWSADDGLWNGLVLIGGRAAEQNRIWIWGADDGPTVAGISTLEADVWPVVSGTVKLGGAETGRRQFPGATSASSETTARRGS